MKTEEFVTALKQKPKCVNSEAMFTDQMRVAFPNEPNERRIFGRPISGGHCVCH